MNPLTLALQAIKEKLQGGPQRPFTGTGQQAELMYGQPFNASHLQTSQSPEEVKQSVDSYANARALQRKNEQKLIDDIAKAKQKLANDEAAHQQMMQNFLHLNAPEHVQAKRMTDSQALIPVGISLLARLGGARDQYIQPALQNYWAGVNHGNEVDAQLQNQNADANFQNQYNQQRFSISESGDQISRQSQDLSALERALIASQDKGEAEDRKDQRARDAGEIKKVLDANKGWPALNDMMIKSYGPDWMARSDANELILQNAPIAMAMTGKDVNRPAQTVSATEENDAQTKRILALIPSDVAYAKARVGLTEANRDAVRQRIAFYPKELEIKAQAAAQGWSRIEVSRDALNSRNDQSTRKEYFAALKTQFDILTKQIKELENQEKINSKGGISPFTFGSATLQALRAQRDELRDRMNENIIAPVLKPTKGRPAPMGGNVPVDPTGPGYDRTKIGSSFNPYEDLLKNL